MNVHEGNAMSWVNVAKNEVVNNVTTQVTSHGRTLSSEEMQEREKRCMNFVVRGFPEPKIESILSLNAVVTNF